ncbi:WhiB family transcriptional regulator [Aestuariimicrobium sp. p3-SID1156]|uniref:WhiB family transcriptional regulator n=1 Tax=Aestuariimicrobium sp. p3-SID1156 TaxID=2916038 RepID=UPI00223BA99D|nr:WhiB family transcriptional regulator [Aestuariimicrobium sp. p3-SID1156]MCT1459396.1 WhiB family transcriptional regulator [Aestuariimicrobium sp. p3-SID1156]
MHARALDTLDQVVDPLEVATLSLPCHDVDPELFFAPEPERVEEAKQVCGPCPLIAECLAGALRRAEPHGVWGGQLLVDGAVVARKRPRGRPRKESVPVVAPAA